MGAATACISRAGASSLAELAAMRLPAVLVPFPAATDNHQFENARAFEKTGAAFLLQQDRTRPEDLERVFIPLMRDEAVRSRMRDALGAWHKPDAASEIAQAILSSVNILAGGFLRSAPQSGPKDPANDRACLSVREGSVA